MVKIIKSEMEGISLVTISSKTELCTESLMHNYKCTISSIRHGQFKFKFYIRDTLMKCCQQPEGNVKFVYHL